MEAAVTEKEAGMTEWNDGRLDDLGQRVDRIEKKMDAGFAQCNKKMDEGFVRLGKKTDEGFARMDARFAKIDERFDEYFFRMDAKFDAVDKRFESLHGMLFKSAWALVIGLLGMLSVLVGVIATQT